MIFHYQYRGNTFRLIVEWTAAEGHSSVFQDIVTKLSARHSFSHDGFCELATHLDDLTDKLYEQIYSFTNEYAGLPYNPYFRKKVLKSLGEIIASVQPCDGAVGAEYEQLLSELFSSIAEKLQAIVKVYLEDHSYQGKFRERYRKKEQYIETTPQHEISFEFEDVLLQMTDLSRQMDCLSITQRRRLVKHVFLNYTFQEIADQEGVGKSRIQRSVAAALNKLKEQA